MSNITTADIAGVFNLDTGRLIGIAPKGGERRNLPGRAGYADFGAACNCNELVRGG